jgi:hypothetical protein
MTSYYFPLGRPATIPTNIDYSIHATTASSAVNASITALTASFASSVLVAPAAGPAGINQNPTLCPTGPAGPRGVQGPTGDAGVSLVGCPPNTKQCTALTGPAPFTLVCIEIPEGCTAGGTQCPDSIDGVVTTTTTTTTSTTTAAPVCYELGNFIYTINSPDTPTNCTTGQYDDGTATLYSTCESPAVACVIYSNDICTTTAVAGLGIHSFTTASLNGPDYYVLNAGTSAISSTGVCDTE